MSEPHGYTQALWDILNSRLGQSITQAFTAGEQQERKRILALITNYWCGEENCKVHGTDWLTFIKEIEDGNK